MTSFLPSLLNKTHFTFPNCSDTGSFVVLRWDIRRAGRLGPHQGHCHGQPGLPRALSSLKSDQPPNVSQRRRRNNENRVCCVLLSSSPRTSVLPSTALLDGDRSTLSEFPSSLPRCLPALRNEVLRHPRSGGHAMSRGGPERDVGRQQPRGSPQP